VRETEERETAEELDTLTIRIEEADGAAGL